mmetsp:Transcript_8911/g.9026  ORF Transcript_8911/g.9026 Transcript_8911/m.9026 type:complete len:88 (-) Transcript_8911:329-592(-)
MMILLMIAHAGTNSSKVIRNESTTAAVVNKTVPTKKKYDFDFISKYRFHNSLPPETKNRQRIYISHPAVYAVNRHQLFVLAYIPAST